MANDWDLFAIARSCSAAAAKFPKRDGNGGNDEVGKNLFNLDGNFSLGEYKDYDRNEVDDDPLDELQHVYRPFYRKAQSAGVAADSAGDGGSGFKHQPVEFESDEGKSELPLQLHRQGSNGEDNGVASGRRLPSQAPSRRKKCPPKLMMRINGKTVSEDSWSWRKYGQKPIKGSPHPRHYYRCSTLKECSARKQVELSPDNAEEYIVSYIGEHIHARPIAQRSTAKSPPTAAFTAATYLSPTTPLIAHYDNNKTQNQDKGNENENSVRMFEEEGDILVPNMQISEEMFMAMHALNSRASQSIVTKYHYPTKDSVEAAGSSE